MQAEIPIQFHCSPWPDAGARSADRFVEFCRCAEARGFESVHVPVTNHLSDALDLARLGGTETSRLRFRIGWDFDGVLASLMGREMQEAWAALRGRLIFHMSFENKTATQNGYFQQAAEFLANCRTLFNELESPEFDIEGQTAEAAFLAIKQANSLWRLPDRPNQVYADVLPILHFGKRVGLQSSVIARQTRQEALDAAAILNLPGDPSSWITPCLWAGLVACWPCKTTAVVGSFEEVARSIHGFKAKGIAQFLIRDLPGQQEIFAFSTKVLPLIRTMEAGGQER